MTSDDLKVATKRFLTTRRAKRLCKDYRANPLDAWGELYLRLQRRATTQIIDDPDTWVNVNGAGVLRNYLRREFIIWP